MASGDAAQPLVSVIVPVYNGAGTIGACLRALAAQDYPADRYEVIVVDNNSTDGTAGVIRQCSAARYVRETSAQSSYAARNRGIGEARGEILAFTDADCVPDGGWLTAGVAACLRPGVGGVAGAVLPQAPATLAQRYAVRHEALSQDTAVRGNSYKPAAYTANAFYRKDAVERVGRFDASVKSGGDAELAWKVQEQLGLSVVFAPDAVVRHEHRARVGELLRQRRNYGYGSVVNYAKRRDRMTPRTLRHSWWDLAAFARKSARGALSGLACAATLGLHRGWRERAALDGLDVLVFLAKKRGQWRAALEHRVWYV